MRADSRKLVFFGLEGVNAFTTSFYFSYLMFLFREQFAYGRKETLAVGALHGLVYLFGSWNGGKLAQRLGYLKSLGLGFAIMLASLAVGGLLPAQPAQVLCLLAWTAGVSLTWPALEALVADGADERALPRIIGLYNLVWAGGAGLGYFLGGALYDHLGSASIYWLPIACLAGQLATIAMLLKRQGAAQATTVPASPPKPSAHAPEAAAAVQPISPARFLHMAWLANPFAYVAINTVILVIPDLARQFQLSATQAGVFCSVWFFTRFVAFAVLWRWTGWHYRFRWLAGSFVALVAGFLLLLLATQLWLVVAAQVLFGAATGLIYYSSLFYSMDVGEASQGEHGGLHEAAIGAGICLGPAIGAGSLHRFPGSPHVGTWAVAGLLLCGFAGLMWLRWAGGRTTKGHQ